MDPQGEHCIENQESKIKNQKSAHPLVRMGVIISTSHTLTLEMCRLEASTMK